MAALLSGSLAVLLLAGAGGWMVATGLTPAEPEAAPTAQPFEVSPEDALQAARAALAAEAAQPSRSEASLGADRLVIPALDVDAPLVLDRVLAGQLQIPSDPGQLTLYEDGGQPCGTQGTVLVAGHVSSYGTPGALHDLARIQPGQVARVPCHDGTVTTWAAVRAEESIKSALPQDVFDSSGEHRLVVVTCGGPVMPNGHYRDNVIVYFVPVAEPEPAQRSTAP